MRQWAALLLLVSAAVACRSSDEPGAPARPAVTTLPPNDPACPGTFAPAGHCRAVAGGYCRYPEGQCECFGFCGGMMQAPCPRGPDRKPLGGCDDDHSRWICAGWPAEGCPPDPPRDGDPCTDTPAPCTYPVCGAGSSACVKGRWKSTVLHFP
ncbi:MAG TPA: hypothetical protein VGL81_19740 [Polyangiaceae bacterium]